MWKQSFSIDWLVLFPSLLISLFGLVIIASTNSHLLIAQLLFIVIGIVVFVIISNIEFQIFLYFSPILYVLSCIFLLITFIGPEVRGSTRWLMIANFRLQSSELVKPFFIVTFSYFFSRWPMEKMRYFLFSLILFIIPIIMLFKQPDLGNVFVYAFFFTSMLLVSNVRLLPMVTMGSLMILFVPFMFSILKEYQRLRLVTFFSPMFDPQGAGYNALQAMIAVGSGGFLGRGFGRGIQSHLRFLPENHTDFIFASSIEEFGLIGGVFLLAIIFFLLMSILNFGKQNVSISIVRIFSIGLFAQIFVQAIINIGMNIGIVPITGITLPLVSYGGSSILATYIALGLFSSMKKATRKNFTLAV